MATKKIVQKNRAPAETKKQIRKIPIKASKKKSKSEPNIGTGGARRDLLAIDVLDKAAVLFAGQGFAATSLQQVADAVGLSRSSIYYYYPSKDALLTELIQGVTLPVAKIFSDVEKLALTPRPTIQEVVRRLVLWVADPRTHFRLMDQSEAQLPAPIAKVHNDVKRRVLEEMVELIEAAVMAGEARAVDPRVTAFSIIGMAMWTAWWFRPGHGQSLEDVAQMVAESATAVLQRAKPEKTGTTVATLSREIRANLALIEKMTGGAGR